MAVQHGPTAGAVIVHAADTDSSGSDAEAGTECRDDCSAHGDRDERAGEACFEEGVAKPREDDELYGDDRDCRHDRRVIAADQKRERVEDVRR